MPDEANGRALERISEIGVIPMKKNPRVIDVRVEKGVPTVRLEVA